MPYTSSPADGFQGQPISADVILDSELVHRHLPYFAKDTVAVVHARRAGWFNARDVGVYLLERAREHGIELVQSRIEATDVVNNRVERVRLQTESGPMLHTKAAFADHLGLVPRDAPLLIWTDLQ